MPACLKPAALVILFAAVCTGQAQPPAPEPAGEPVTLGGVVVFRVQEGFGSFTAKDRAQAASRRLNALAMDVTADIGNITVADTENASEVVLGDRVILTVTEEDAKHLGTTTHAAALSTWQTIRVAVQARRAAYSSRSLLLGALWTTAASVIFLLLLWLLWKIFRSLHTRLERRDGKDIRPIRIQSVELLSEDQLRLSLARAATALRILLTVSLFYFYVSLELSFFPWTREYAPILYSHVLHPLGEAFAALVDYVPNLIVVVLCCSLAFLIVRFARFIFAEIEKGRITIAGFYPEWARPSEKLVRFLIIAFTAVVTFPYLPGSSSPGFRGVSIFVGVLISLGSSSAVSNIIGGVILTYTRAFQVGDRVRVGDTTGDVVEKTLLATRIRTIKNEEVTVPNSLVMGTQIVNYSSNSQTAGLILHTSVTIGYNAPWRTVHRLLIDAALETDAIQSDPRPFVLQTSLDDFFVTYQINAYTAQPNRMPNIYGELHERIQDHFNAAGVEIMSPHYSSIRDGNKTTIPDEYLPKNYSAPGFRIWQKKATPDSHEPDGEPS